MYDFLIDIPFKGKSSLAHAWVPLDSGVNIDVRCHWHLPPVVNGVLDNRTPVVNGGIHSRPPVGQRCQWHSPPVVKGVIDTAHQWSAVSLTPPTSGPTVSLTLPTGGQRCHWHRPPVGQWCHWHCPPVVNGVIGTAHQWSMVSLTLPSSVQGFVSRISWRIRIHIRNTRVSLVQMALFDGKKDAPSGYKLSSYKLFFLSTIHVCTTR
jgi:hypothetical protein